jgi:hypothetical protein
MSICSDFLGFINYVHEKRDQGLQAEMNSQAFGQWQRNLGKLESQREDLQNS